MSFTIYFESMSDDYVAYMFHFIDGKMVWARNAEGAKRTDASDMEEYLQAAKDSGLPSRVIFDD